MILNIFTQVNWQSILTATITFFILLIIKFLLDLNLGKLFVKYFHYLPVRNFFRNKPILIKGKWEEKWDLKNTDNFNDPTNRHSHPVIKQLDKYCYSEFIAKGTTYCIFGKVVNDHFIGEWYDKNDPIGYYGTFHLLIINKNSMHGKWIGHSKKEHGIREGNWEWVRYN